MTSALIIGMLVAILVGAQTDSIVLAGITWVVVSAAAYFALRLLSEGMGRGINAASDALSKTIEKKMGDKK